MSYDASTTTKIMWVVIQGWVLGWLGFGVVLQLGVLFGAAK